MNTLLAILTTLVILAFSGLTTAKERFERPNPLERAKAARQKVCLLIVLNGVESTSLSRICSGSQ